MPPTRPLAEVRCAAAVILGALASALLASCTLYEPPSDEEIARNRAIADARRAEDAIKGRALLEAALASGEDTMMITFALGDRMIGRDFELRDNEFCSTTLATRGTARFNDYWTDLDYSKRATPIPTRCMGYSGIKRVRSGDVRR